MSDPSPCFSPSQTQTWVRCPRLWKLSREWEPCDKWTPNRLMGEAIHAGLAAKYAPEPEGLLPEQAAGVTLGIGWPEHTEGHEAAWLVVQRCLNLALKLDVLQGGRVMAVEQEIGPERCRPDLVIEDERGLRVIDWKYRDRLQPEYVARQLREYTHSWQMWHYAWRVSQELGKPVYQHETVLIVGSPKAKAHPPAVTSISPTQLERWAEGAQRVWDAMARGESWMAMGQACSMLGGCDFWGCWEWESPPEAMFKRKEATQ